MGQPTPTPEVIDIGDPPIIESTMARLVIAAGGFGIALCYAIASLFVKWDDPGMTGTAFRALGAMMLAGCALQFLAFLKAERVNARQGRRAWAIFYRLTDLAVELQGCREALATEGAEHLESREALLAAEQDRDQAIRDAAELRTSLAAAQSELRLEAALRKLLEQENDRKERHVDTLGKALGLVNQRAAEAQITAAAYSQAAHGDAKDAGRVFRELLDTLEAAWAVIANVSGGMWARQGDDWFTAASRWRDRYHGILNRHGREWVPARPDLDAKPAAGEWPDPAKAAELLRRLDKLETEVLGTRGLAVKLDELRTRVLGDSYPANNPPLAEWVGEIATAMWGGDEHDDGSCVSDRLDELEASINGTDPTDDADGVEGLVDRIEKLEERPDDDGKASRAIAQVDALTKRVAKLEGDQRGPSGWPNREDVWKAVDECKNLGIAFDRLKSSMADVDRRIGEGDQSVARRVGHLEVMQGRMDGMLRGLLAEKAAPLPKPDAPTGEPDLKVRTP